MMFKVMLVAAVCIMCSSSASGQRDAGADQVLNASVLRVIQAADALRPGMTRAEVLRYFKTEGGLSVRALNHYVYRGCPYIKIDVAFEAPPGGGPELLTDRIITVSKPYLQYPIMD